MFTCYTVQQKSVLLILVFTGFHFKYQHGLQEWGQLLATSAHFKLLSRMESVNAVHSSAGGDGWKVDFFISLLKKNGI